MEDITKMNPDQFFEWFIEHHNDVFTDEERIAIDTKIFEFIDSNSLVKNQISLLEDVWAERLSALDKELDFVLDLRAEKELEIGKCKIDADRMKRKKREIVRQADKLERAKFRSL